MNKGSQDNARYNHMMAALADAGKDADSAKKHYQSAIVNNPTNALTRSDYALHLSEQGRAGFRQAQDEYRKALILQEDNPTLRKNYGAMLGRRGDYRGALNQTERALQINNNDTMTHRNLAMINNQLGDTHSALKHNRISMALESRRPTEQRDTKAYRAAAVQIISTGGKKEEAYAMMDAARALENRRFVLPTTEGTDRVLQMMLERRGDAVGELEREQAKKRASDEAEEQALKSGDVKTLLAKIKSANTKKSDDD